MATGCEEISIFTQGPRNGGDPAETLRHRHVTDYTRPDPLQPSFPLQPLRPEVLRMAGQRD